MNKSALPSKKALWIAGVISAFAWILAVPLASYIAKPKPEKQEVEGYYWPENAGTVGDAFGGLTCLFSGFSFCLLIYSILREREDSSEEKQLLREQIIEAKVASHVEKLPFFIVTIGAYGIQISNAAHDAFNVVARLFDSGDNVVGENYNPVVKSGKSFEVKNSGRQTGEYLLRLDYIAKDGMRSDEHHSVRYGLDRWISCTSHESHAQNYRTKLLSQATNHTRG